MLCSLGRWPGDRCDEQDDDSEIRAAFGEVDRYADQHCGLAKGVIKYVFDKVHRNRRDAFLRVLP